ncbi:MAG TPA: hypothetical protein DCX92_05100, partial [Bacteroidetes bacterium]|nr:hypothetical protein [Bacteroidota bacterium]
MKKTEPINTFDKLFSFTKLKAILEVYVLILAIIGIYLTIGQFSIRYEPKVEIVDYIYVFNVNYLKGLIGSKSEYAKILNYSPTFKRLIDNYDIQAPIRIYGLDFTKRHQIRYILPYEVNDSNINREGWSNNSDNNTWFRLGLDSLPMDTTMFYIYNSAGRSNEEKKIGISLLFTAIVLNDTNLIKRYPQTEKIEVNAFGIDTLGSNPLQELKSNIAIDTNNIIEDFLFRYSSFSGMRIYTLTSISNISNSPVENLNLFINQSTEYAPLKIEGW